MRLGELRTRTRDLDNKYKLKVSLYTVYGVRVFDLEWDMMNNSDELYFRLVEEDNNVVVE